MQNLVQRVEQVVPGAIEDVKRLVAIQSVSSLPERTLDVEDSAQLVAELLKEAGCPDARLLNVGGKTAVLAAYPAPAGMPTVCLYAHHDVQPTGDLEKWTSDPFQAAVRGDRLYGRGAADDKGGIGVHLATLRAFDGKPPVGVKLLIEGEEEIGSPTINDLIAENHEAISADVFVVADANNWLVGTPAFTTRLRGMASVTVTVSTLDHALHSGQFGGAVPDAVLALIKLLGTLHDEAGSVAVPGLAGGESLGVDYPADRMAAEAGLLPGVQPIGVGAVADRVWTEPAITVVGMDVTSVANASNTLAPTARAKVSLRVAPGQDSAEQAETLRQHLLDHAPWGAHVDVVVNDMGQPAIIETGGSGYAAATAAATEAFGVPPVEVGIGGSIPLVAELQDAYPDATILLTAVGDPDSRMHGIDESLHLGDFEKACKLEALLLANLARSAASTK